MSKLLIIAGAILVLLGLGWNFLSKMPLIGRLPGDIFIQKKNFTFYFPLTTSVLLSVLLTLIFWIFSKYTK